ncbi:hypothetical protein BBJ28_00026201 [Nothophytophthora sp. Chile5]|nr:hypothetical protein BBJ28_00026201 [Nothophytophthora sp. Chile5]
MAGGHYERRMLSLEGGSHLDGEGSTKHDYEFIRSFRILPEKPPSRLKKAWTRACSLFHKKSESLDLNGTKWLTESEYNSSDVGTTVAFISTADSGLSANWNDPLPDEEDSSNWRVPLPDEDVSAEFGSGFDDDDEEAMTGVAPAA